MNDKMGIAELLAIKNLGGGDEKSATKTGAGALWAIFVIILIFAVIWLAGGNLLGGISKNTTVGGLLGDDTAEQEEVRRLRNKDQIDAEFYRQGIANKNDLAAVVAALNKNISDTATIVTERGVNYADKGDFRLEHREQMDVCKLQQEIDTLNCSKLDKEHKRVTWCADTPCPTQTGITDIAGLQTALELILDKLSDK